MMQRTKRNIKKAIVSMAKKSAGMEVNTACPIMNYQPKEPQEVKKLSTHKRREPVRFTP